jgi:hypothetical protein
MKNKRITALVSLLLMITGCSSLNSNQSTPLSSGGYAAILPFETSDMRVKHSGYLPVWMHASRWKRD